MTLEQVVSALEDWAGDEDMCSVQINNCGKFYLGLGNQPCESMTLEEFTKFCEGHLP